MALYRVGSNQTFSSPSMNFKSSTIILWCFVALRLLFKSQLFSKIVKSIQQLVNYVTLHKKPQIEDLTLFSCLQYKLQRTFDPLFKSIISTFQVEVQSHSFQAVPQCVLFSCCSPMSYVSNWYRMSQFLSCILMF